MTVHSHLDRFHSLVACRILLLTVACWLLVQPDVPAQAASNTSNAANAFMMGAIPKLRWS